MRPFQPTGDQPEAIRRLSEGLAKGYKQQTLLGATGTGQDVHDRSDHPERGQADARAGPQQDARGAAVQRVPGLLPGQRGRVLRVLLRLLPARGVPAPERHVHREGLVPQRRDRQAPPRRDAGAVRAQGRHHRGQRQLHLRPGRARGLRRDRASGCASAAAIAGTASCASSSTSSTSATTRRCRRAKFRVRGDTLELQPAYDDFIVRVQFFGDEVERITELDPVTGELLAERNELNVYPASHYVTPQEKLKEAIVDIEAEADAAGRGAGGEGHDPGGGAPPPADHLRRRDDARAGLLLGHRELLPPPVAPRGRARGRGRCSTTSRPTGCWSWTRAT